MYTRRRRSARSTHNMWHQGVSNCKNPTHTQRKGMIIGQGPNYQSQYKGSISYQGLQQQAEYLIDNHFVNYFSGPYRIDITNIPATDLFTPGSTTFAILSNTTFAEYIESHPDKLPELDSHQRFEYIVNYMETNVPQDNHEFKLNWSSIYGSNLAIMNFSNPLSSPASVTNIIVPISDTSIQIRRAVSAVGGDYTYQAVANVVPEEYQPIDSTSYGQIPFFSNIESFDSQLELTSLTDISPVLTQLSFNFYLSLYPVDN